MKKIILSLLILITLNISIFATTTFRKGLDLNLNDVGISFIQRSDNLNIKASIAYPLFAILNNKNFNNTKIEDYFESFTFHGVCYLNIFSYKSFFLNLGVASDVFLQFDYSKVNSHYTCFSLGPYAELGYTFFKKQKKDLEISMSLNLPIILNENKKTDYMDPTIIGWNPLINFNDSIFYMIFMAYKINISIPF